MENDDCCCKHELDRIPRDIPDSFSGKEKLLIDFGKVEVGRKKWLKYDIRNPYNENIEYTITRDPTTNPLYHVFNFSSYKFIIPAKSSSSLKISYKPLYPETGDVDCFHLTNSTNGNLIICTEGMGIGPHLQISTTFLRFNTWDDQKTCRQTVEIRNESEIEAVLHLDVDANDPVFKIDNMNFSIPGKKHVYMTINFTPGNYGVFQRRIECLILHHEPILLEVFGVHSKNNKFKDYVLISCPQKIRTRRNYCTYMEDVQMVMQENPLFSLTEIYIDFGGVSLGTNNVHNSNNCKTITTSLTNHMNTNILVKFEEDPIFDINPKEIEIPSLESALFECAFSPDKPDFIFNKKQSGTVWWKDERAFSKTLLRLETPLLFSVNLLGHSFLEDTFWLPQLEIIPEVIVLPPTVPGAPSFYTFELRTGGYLPVAFKCLPPKKTNFIIKPMLGLVTGYSLLVVQLQSESRQQPKVYTEKWSIMLNDRKDHLIHFYLKGFSEIPDIIVGDQNRVKFGCVQTGCTEKLVIPIKNNCQHRLSYKFMVDEIDYLIIANPVGELAPNQTIRLDWSYHAFSNACVKYPITCLVHVLEKMHGIVGSPFEFEIDVYTESDFSELCCIPNYRNLGTIECQIRKTVCVSVYNFGPTIVHYVLEKAGSDDGYLLNIIGASGTVNPGEKAEVFVEYTPFTVGKHEVSVIYKIRKSCDSREILPNFQKTIFRIKCTSVYPYLQVVDILHHNFGQLFTKCSLWDLFNIESLNNVLRIAQNDSSEQIEIRTPDNEISQDEYFVVFLVKNMTPFNYEVELKRRKVCDCPLLQVGDSVSLRKKEYACPHRDIFSINMDKKEIKPGSLHFFQISIRYIMEGSNLMSYEMIFPSNRRLILDFTIKSLSESDSVLSIYSPKFGLKLSPVCLSEINPQIQAFWFYNNTDKEVEFSLDLEEIDNVNCVYEYEVLKCINPNGIIEGHSRLPLLFKFVPVKRKTFNVNLPLRMGNEETVFLLSGDGRKSFQGYIKAIEKIGQYDLKFDIPIMLSEDYLQLNPMPTWSSSSAMTFIRNTSENSIIGYSWHGYGIDGIVEANMKPRKGVLCPGDSHPIMLQVKCFGKPCKLRLQVVCKLLNHNEYYLHKKSLTAYNCKQEQIKDEFTITEKGITYPTNDVYVYPFPKQFYTSLSTEIIVTSIPDRDIHHSPQEQLTHFPTNVLPMDDSTANICLEFPHSSQESIFTTWTYFERKEVQSQNKEEEENMCGGEEQEEEFDIEEVEFYKDTLECIVADALFSTLFFETLKIRRFEAPIFYEQIRTSRQDIENDVAKREKCIQELFVRPPTSVVANLFEGMLLDSLNEVFEIDLQTKKLEKSNIVKEIEKSTEC